MDWIWPLSSEAKLNFYPEQFFAKDDTMIQQIWAKNRNISNNIIWLIVNIYIESLLLRKTLLLNLPNIGEFVVCKDGIYQIIFLPYIFGNFMHQYNVIDSPIKYVSANFMFLVLDDLSLNYYKTKPWGVYLSQTASEVETYLYICLLISAASLSSILEVFMRSALSKRKI